MNSVTSEASPIPYIEPYTEVMAMYVIEGAGGGTGFKVKEKDRLLAAFDNRDHSFTGETAGTREGSRATIDLTGVNEIWLLQGNRMTTIATRELP